VGGATWVAMAVGSVGSGCAICKNAAAMTGEPKRIKQPRTTRAPARTGMRPCSSANPSQAMARTAIDVPIEPVSKSRTHSTEEKRAGAASGELENAVIFANFPL